MAIGDLALLTFRGGLGLVEGEFGGSDLAWRHGRPFIAHNAACCPARPHPARPGRTPPGSRGS